MILQKMLLTIKLFRLQSVIIMNLFIFLPLEIETGNPVFSIFQTLPFVLMIAGEIALNDCCDLKKDRINKPQRPLVSGVLKLRYAKIMTGIVILFGIILGIFMYYPNIKRMLIFMSVAAILSIYNVRLPFISTIKTFMTALATVLSLSFVFTFIDIPQGICWFLMTAFMFILGREFMMDIRDMQGDLRENYKTLAIILGKRKAIIASLFFIICSDIFCVLFILSQFSMIKIILLVFLIAFELFCIYHFIKSESSVQQNKCILLLWIPMIFMLLM